LEEHPASFTSARKIKQSNARMIAATGLFGALAILLTSLSQALGLNFPILPYLQFDFGEVAIVIAFLLFGPIPATTAAFVEFLTLMVLGENIPWGPVLKIIAVLSTLGGLWFGMMLAKKASKSPKMGVKLGSCLGTGVLFRAAFMTVANYYLIVFIYTVGGMTSFLGSAFKLIGLTISNANALTLILGFTAIFNCLQLLLVFGISFALVRLPQLRRSLRSNRMAWFESFGTTIEERK
jgi:riboflavin transporter FmnP